ncbi:MAG: hypothetical protein HRF50_16995 [Phycisphaerae bacterium]|jgi:ABC-type sugar transport system substrate-binding protein
MERTIKEVLHLTPHAVCVWTDGDERVDVALTTLVHSGILVVTFGRHADVSGLYGEVEVNWPQAAELLGQELHRIAGARRSYALIHEKSRSPRGRTLYDRFNAVAQRQHGLSGLAEVDLHDEANPGVVIGGVLSRFPNVGFVVTLTAAPWLEDDGRLLRDAQPSFATVGAVPALWPAIRSGRALALAGPIDGDIGRAAAAVAVAGLTRSEPFGVYRGIACELVWPATLDDFSRRYRAAAGWSAGSAGSQSGRDGVTP